MSWDSCGSAIGLDSLAVHVPFMTSRYMTMVCTKARIMEIQELIIVRLERSKSYPRITFDK